MAAYVQTNLLLLPAGTRTMRPATAGFISAALVIEWGPGARGITTVSSGFRFTLVAPPGWWSLLHKDDRMPVNGWLSIIWHLVRMECILLNTKKTVIERYIIIARWNFLKDLFFQTVEHVWKLKSKQIEMSALRTFLTKYFFFTYLGCFSARHVFKEKQNWLSKKEDREIARFLGTSKICAPFEDRTHDL